MHRRDFGFHPRVDEAGNAVAIVVPYPGHIAWLLLVAAFWGDVEQVVDIEEQVETARVGRVGVEDVSCFVACENAEAGKVGDRVGR